MENKANPIIDELNKILTNTLDYKEVLQKLAHSVSDNATSDKLHDLSKLKGKEAETLIKVISDMGGAVESTERMTDHESVSWVKRPLPDPENMQAILACLIKAERNIENDYTDLLSHKDLDREYKNHLDRHRKEAEANLKYFQSAQQTLDHKVQ